MQTVSEIKSVLESIKDIIRYKEYLKIIDSLIDCKEDSLEEETLELVSILVEDYESKHYLIEAPDPIEAIKIKME